MSTVGGIDNNGSESPRKVSIKPIFEVDKKAVRHFREISSQGHNNKSKQAKKSFAAQNSVVWKSHLAVIRPLPEEASTEGVTGYID